MSTTLTAHIQTPKGTFKINLRPDIAPLTVANFVQLAQRGFYKDNQFHRVIADFVIQGGCPLGNGTGGPGYRFKDECSPILKHDKAGILSMANAGPGTNGSQFFVTLSDTPHLDGMHTVFGAVADDEDMAIVKSIAVDDVLNNIIIEGDTSELFEQCKEQLQTWNDILEAQKTTSN